MIFAIGVILLLMASFGFGLYTGTRIRQLPDGQIVIKTDEEGNKSFALKLDRDMAELVEMGTVIFKVVDPAE